MHGNYKVFLGLDVGKDGHHAVALNRDGKRLHDAALVNTETKLRQVFDKLAQHGRDSWWSTSPRRPWPCRSRSPAPALTKSPTCPDRRCGGSLARIRARRRPTPVTPT